MGVEQGLGVPTDWAPVDIANEHPMKHRTRRGPCYLLSPHLLRQAQWNVCEQGTVTSPVTAASILSKQTGQVGSSYAPETRVDAKREILCETWSSTSIAIDTTRTTWHVSG